MLIGDSIGKSPYIYLFKYSCLLVLSFVSSKTRKINQALNTPSTIIRWCKDKKKHQQHVPYFLDKSLHLWISMNYSHHSKVIPRPQQSPQSTLILKSNHRTPYGGIRITDQGTIYLIHGTTLLNQHGVTITSAWTQIWYPFWLIKAETIICNIIHNSPLLWPYLPKNISICIYIFLFNDIVEKNFYIQYGLYGDS